MCPGADIQLLIMRKFWVQENDCVGIQYQSELDPKRIVIAVPKKILYGDVVSLYHQCTCCNKLDDASIDFEPISACLPSMP